jgi:tetratricopeptide (TPR) repeat protein
MAVRTTKAMLAEDLSRAGRIGSAVQACLTALQDDASDPVCRAILAELLLREDFYDRAIAEATSAIESDPACAPAYLVLGLAYDRRGGMWDQSVLVWHELAEVVPDLVTAHVQLGEAFSAAAFEDEAIEAWTRALELDPTEPRAMYDLAVAALRREGPATALPGFRRAGSLDPSQDELVFDILGVGAADKVPAVEDLGEGRDERLHAAAVYAARDDLLAATEVVRMVLDRGADDSRALALAAYCYIKQESDNEAMACALRALQVAPDDPCALYCLGVVYAKRPGLYRQAARAWATLAYAVPDHPMPQVLLAEALVGLQRYKRAREAYLTAVRLDPACVRARFGLAAVYISEGRHAEASWEIRRAAYYDTKRKDLFWRLYDEYVEGGEE